MNSSTKAFGRGGRPAVGGGGGEGRRRSEEDLPPKNRNKMNFVETSKDTTCSTGVENSNSAPRSGNYNPYNKFGVRRDVLVPNGSNYSTEDDHWGCEQV